MANLYIKEINLISFGHFENKTIYLTNGFNLIYGDNESGKSTILDFIEGVFYGFDQGKSKINFSYKKEKYKPLGSFKYSGSLLISAFNKDYRIFRNFDSGEYEIYDLENNKNIEGKKSNLNFPGEYFLKLNYSLYKSLINKQQMQETSKDAKKKIIDFLKNPSSDLDFSALKAKQNIDDMLKKIGSKRAYTKPYAKNLKKLEKKEEDLSYIKSLRKSYEKDLSSLKKQRQDIKDIEKDISDLKDKTDKYRKSKASYNYIEEKSRKDALEVINRKLKNYSEFKDIDQFYFEKVDELIKRKNDYYKESKNEDKKSPFPLVIALIIILISFVFKNLYILLALIVPIFMKFYQDKNEDDSLDLNNLNNRIKAEFIKVGAKNKSQYENKKVEYKDYKNLLIEKEKNMEILSILDKQEKYKEDLDFEYEENFDLESIENDLRIKENKFESIRKKNLNLEKKLAAVEEDISKENELVEDIKNIKSKISDLELEIKAAERAIDLIDSLKDKFEYNKAIIENDISRIIRELSRGNYEKISYDENLNPLIKKKNNEFISPEKLSVGFYDQVNFALSFVISENLLENLFLVFDDAFINYDNNRLRMALLYLLDMSDSFQIIYFTCHKREIALFEAEGIDVDIKYMEKI